MEKKSLTKIIIPFHRNSYNSELSRIEEKYNHSKIPTELKSIKKRSFQEKIFYKNSSNKNIFNFRSYLLDLKSIFTKLISRKKEA